MRIGLICLVAAYILCQFYRAFLAVLAPVLQTDIGAGSDDLALASGVWFLTFALMQIPVGVALDSIAPRRTAVSLFALGGAGGGDPICLCPNPAAPVTCHGPDRDRLFTGADGRLLHLCPPAVFATRAAAIIGFASLGNIAGSALPAWAVD